MAWDFNGDGTADNTTDNTATFTFDTPGTYNATLTVTNAGGSDSISMAITVSVPVPDAPVASFTCDLFSGDAPLTVTFTNTSTGSVDTLAWDFNGDGTADNTTDNTATFTFDTPGTYNATLTVTNAGGSDSISLPITVNVPIPDAPLASFTCDLFSGSAPLTVTFTNTSTGSVDSLAWDFNGDGTADNTTDNTATFTFDTPGTYNATLTVTNAGGSNSATRMITVSEPVPDAPVASFTCDLFSGSAPLTVTFTNTSTGSVDSLAWDFNGDGTADNTTDNTATFTFDTPGTCNATLTVTNAGGSDSISLPITVNVPIPDAPVASFTCDLFSGSAPLTVTFTNTSTGSVDSLAWDFNGDGTADNTTDNTATFTFDTPGTYNATLTVANAGGSNSISMAITVSEPIPDAPVASFTCDSDSGDAPLTVTFTNTSTGSVDSLAWDFNGDGTADNTTDNTATFTFDTPGTYNATLTVTNAGGSNSATQMITVNVPVPDAPVASFTCDLFSGSAPLTVTFTNTSTGSVDSLAWDFNGDGTADNTTDNTATFTFDTPGTCNATLTVTNAGGSNSTTQMITVNESVPDAPVASFTCDFFSGSAPLTVTFTNTSTGSVDSLAWDFNGDGTADNTTDNTATFTFDTPGTYNATLTVTNAGGSNSATHMITVNVPIPDAPVASFTCDLFSGSAPLTVTFTNTSTGSVDSLAWDFNGDGTADNTTDNTATFTFDTPGTYNATLTVTNAGGSNSATHMITVNVPIPDAPVASFTCDLFSGSAPLTVTFTNTSTGSVDSLAWDFNGDGSADNTTDNTATFTFDTPGTYNATLTVTNAGGSNSATRMITVSEPVPDAPVASFTCDLFSGSAPLTVTFTNTSTGSVDSLAWDFNGDGTADNTTDNTATFTFDTPGTYTATLTVTNAGGSNSISLPITVNVPIPDAPVASFTCDPFSGDAPLMVTFTNTSTGSVDSLAWDFNGDGTADNTTDNTATFTFDTPGTYNATLTVTNAGGSDSISLPITVNVPIPDAPVASFTCDLFSGSAPLTVTFTNTSTGSVDSLAWDFNGDGTADNTTDNTATFTFDTPGTYNATLTVTNAGGSDSISMAITVSVPVPDAPVASFTCDLFSGSAPLTVTFTNTSTGSVDSLAWDFNGDGTADNTTDNTATFTFDTPGTYTATLTVTNAGGSDTALYTILVN